MVYTAIWCRDDRTRLYMVIILLNIFIAKDVAYSIRLY